LSTVPSLSHLPLYLFHYLLQKGEAPPLATTTGVHGVAMVCDETQGRS
jgi:hypothetical protein